MRTVFIHSRDYLSLSLSLTQWHPCVRSVSTAIFCRLCHRRVVNPFIFHPPTRSTRTKTINLAQSIRAERTIYALNSGAQHLMHRSNTLYLCIPKPKIKSSNFSNLNYFNVNVYFNFGWVRNTQTPIDCRGKGILSKAIGQFFITWLCIAI